MAEVHDEAKVQSKGAVPEREGSGAKHKPQGHVSMTQPQTPIMYFTNTIGGSQPSQIKIQSNHHIQNLSLERLSESFGSGTPTVCYYHNLLIWS